MNPIVTERGLGRAALGGVGATILWQGVRLVILALSIVILARLLDPADYGLVVMATALIGVGELLRDMGLSMAAVQARNVSRSEKSNLFWVNTCIGGALTVIVFCLAGPISSFYGRPELLGITQALSFTFLINGLATQFKAQINRDLRFMMLGMSEAVPQALGLGVAVWWAVEVGGYGALVLQALIVAGGGLAFSVAFARWWPGLFDRHTSIRRFLGFGGALVGTQSLAYMSKNLDTILLGITVGSSQLGWYNRAYQIVVLPLTQLTAPMSRVAVPILSRVKEDRVAFLRYVRAGQFFSLAIASTLYGIVIGLAPALVDVVLGPQWQPSAPIIQALALSGVFRAMGQVPYWLFLAKGFAGKQFRFYLVAQPLVIVGILLGLPHGPVGVGIGLSTGYGLFWIAQMWWAARATDTPTLGLVRSALIIVATIGLPVAAIGFAAQLVSASSLAAVLSGVGASAVYVAAILWVVPANRAQLRVAWRLIKK